MKIKVKEAAVKVWNWFNGKKTTIGAIAQTALIVIRLVKPNLLSDSTYIDIQWGIGFWFGISLGHKAAKKEWSTETQK